MIHFPSTTIVRRRLSKEAFYRHLDLSPALKKRFISDVEQIMVEHSLTAATLHLGKTGEIREILVVSLALKKSDFDKKILEAIARQNPHKLVFLIRYGDKCRLALYQSRLYQTPWMEERAVTLSAEGASMDEIWQHFVESIALPEEERPEEDKTAISSLADRLSRQEKIKKLEAVIRKLEAAMRREKQSKKKFDLYTKLENYRKELEALKKE